jgi:hypothetical protein
LRSLVDSQSSIPEGGEENDEKDDRGRAMNTVRYGVNTQSMPR